MQAWRYLPRLGSLAGLSEIFTVVIDTSVITSDVIATLKGKLPSPLFLAMKTGLVRGFMAHHTWAEVPRVLAKRAPREGVDPQAAEGLWWNSYVKAIRFVPTGDLPHGDPELSRALAERDATDVPTLKVLSLIAPTVLLTADRDLKDIGLAYERWREVPEGSAPQSARHSEPSDTLSSACLSSTRLPSLSGHRPSGASQARC